jgi:hypothetical protein
VRNRKSEPSIFLGVLAGYAVASAIGALIVIWLSIDLGRATAEGGLKVLTPIGALGAFLGYQITVKRRKARGINGPYDEWSKFFGSWLSIAIGMIVIAGAFGIAVLIKLAYDALAG